MAPFWMEEMVNRLGLWRTGYSKYVTAVDNAIEHNPDEINLMLFLFMIICNRWKRELMGMCSCCFAFSLCPILDDCMGYTLTYQGLSYLRSFVHTLALSGVISALVMLAIGDSVAIGIGVVGALTIIRFRTTLKDTRILFSFLHRLRQELLAGF